MSWRFQFRPHKLALAILFASSAVVSLSQVREGIYRPDAKTAVNWSINESHTLIWNGEPYMPVGARVDLNPEAIKSVTSSGVKDLVVDAPASGSAWEAGVEALRTTGARFLLRINSLAPTARGFAVQPGAYRLSGIVSPKAIMMDLPDAKSALVVLALRRDGSIQKFERVPVISGKLTYLAKPGNDLEHVLLVYPETVSLEQIDWWEGMDSHRDEVMASISRAKLGPGLRAIVNPFGRVASLPGKEIQFIPDSNYFRAEFKQALLHKYKNLELIQRSWAMSSNNLATVDDLCRLVPLWSGQRGVSFLWSPVSNRLFQVESRKSNFWRDISEVVANAAVRRQERLVRAIRRVANVPVIQEWNGWSSLYEGDQVAVDGIGARISGKTQAAIVESGCRASSTVLRWNTRGWLAATDVDPESAADEIWPIGPRAIYYRATTPAQLKAIAAQVVDTTRATQTLKPLYYPEAAANPASPQRLPGERWWFPAPTEGNRIDLGSKFYAYRIRLPQGPQIVMWTKEPKRYRMRLKNAKSVGFSTLDGTDPKPKIIPNGVEVALNEYPTIISGTDEYPVPEDAFLETASQFETLITDSERLHRDISEERYFFLDYFKDFDKNPAGSLVLMRNTVYKTAHKLGIALWFEAENSVENNFSETVVLGGCSNQQALELHQPVAIPDSGFYIQFNLSPSRETYDVWLAAKVAPDRRGDVTVEIGSQIFGLTAEPVGVYGNGFGWYKVGQVKLSGGGQRMRVVVSPTALAEIAVDSIVLTNLPFAPDGVVHPDPRRAVTK